MTRTIGSWDRIARPPSHSHFTGGTSPLGTTYDPDGCVPVRVVVWPKDAPDPSTVPHAGELVTFSGSQHVYTVVNGILKWDKIMKVWRLWVHNPNTGRLDPEVGDLTIYEDPPRTYTEAEIRAAFEGKYNSGYEDSIIKVLRDRS